MPPNLFYMTTLLVTNSGSSYLSYFSCSYGLIPYTDIVFNQQLKTPRTILIASAMFSSLLLTLNHLHIPSSNVPYHSPLLNMSISSLIMWLKFGILFPQLTLMTLTILSLPCNTLLSITYVIIFYLLWFWSDHTCTWHVVCPCTNCSSASYSGSSKGQRGSSTNSSKFWLFITVTRFVVFVLMLCLSVFCIVTVFNFIFNFKSFLLPKQNLQPERRHKNLLLT